MPVPSADLIEDVVEQLSTPTGEMLLSVGRSTVPVSNLDKPLWPGARGAPLTKRDLLVYLAKVSPYLLPHLEGRPLFVTRYPHGAGGERFFQKHWDSPPPFARTVAVWSKESRAARDYLVVANLQTLLWLGQLAAIELHTWFSRVAPRPDAAQLGTRYADSAEDLEASRLNYPDFLIVDLDAYDYSGREAAGAEPELHRRGFNRVRSVAFEVERIAGALGLRPYVKTSGRTGLHIFLPIVRRFTYDEVRSMAEMVGQFLVSLRPKDVTLAWSVRDRAGKVFFDFNQNVRGKSLVSAYSPRPHPAGTVSMPVSWAELAQVYPTDFTLRTVPALLAERGDRWADILDAKEDLEAILGAKAS
jgi:bifunctional non-homologous end joining protein LigD